MAQDERYWIDRAQSAEAKLKTLQDATDPAIERIQRFKTNFGVIEKTDGSIDIDFQKFASALPLEHALELRKIIDEVHGISGKPGEKPHVRFHAQEQLDL